MTDALGDGLDGILKSKIDRIGTFRDQQGPVWQLVDASRFAARSMIVAAATQGCRSVFDTRRVMMWYTLLDYQLESFFLILDGKLGEGAALLRMAAELARDLNQIGRDPDRLATWAGRRHDKAGRSAYRKAFRFNDDDPIEQHVRRLYDLTSEQGVHGHELTSVNLEPSALGVVGDNVGVEVPDLAIYRLLGVWLAAFFPLHDLASRHWDWAAHPTMVGTRQSAVDIRLAFDEVFHSYRMSLSEMEAAARGSVH